MKSKDIDNPELEFNKLSDRFKLLYDRFLAIAMDYKHYINDEMGDKEIYDLRDNVLYRLYSARFHLQLLLEHHFRIEKYFQELYKKKPAELFQGGFELSGIKDQSTREIYSLFDSTMYHLCSIYDYLFQIINFAHGKTIADEPKWNLYRNKKNKENQIFCSAEMITIMDKIDKDFVYPLIRHRSHLIHTHNDTGDFKLSFNLGGDKFSAKFHATKLFIENFPECKVGNEEFELTIKYISFWLIDKTLQTTTEILFELRDDMIRNQKIPHGMVVLLGANNEIIPASTPLWGDRSKS